MTDLDKLIEAVEAGQLTSDELPDSHVTHWQAIVDAYNGSLDAAKRLHDALLGPDWSVSIALGAAFWDVDITHYPYRDEDRRPDWNVTAGPEQDPARAWLLAILRAVKAKDTP